ncbi:helix-turn-helix domain-containing protein [Streptomyces cacaoi]|uniref:HTH iclR-type domain-containing protein n=1 Tax=Streptomyces cacaoi TaxID=1898 RepID=A0A4Y3R4U2_STRCI|nr:helix-turn-helix domain-containing protein [Streptomyces cacaoi]GEB50970.1 hypothetical protein SCA03_35210 [Streptomyces cacaoi]
MTGARAQIFQALTDNPGCSAATLALSAGLSRSTARKALATLEDQGIAVGEKGNNAPGKTTPNLWHPTPEAAPGQVRPLPGQGSEPTPDTAAPETGSAQEEQPKAEPKRPHSGSGDSAEVHPATGREAGAPLSPGPDHEVRPGEVTEPEPLQEESVPALAPDPEHADNPPETHPASASLDTRSPTSQSGDSAPAREEGRESRPERVATGEPAPAASTSQPPTDITRPEPGKFCPPVRTLAAVRHRHRQRQAAARGTAGSGHRVPGRPPRRGLHRDQDQPTP